LFRRSLSLRSRFLRSLKAQHLAPVGMAGELDRGHSVGSGERR
jgi:hypothetical protein